MMSSSRKFAVLSIALSVVLVAACSSGNKRPEYYDSVETASLEIPEGLQPPNQSQALVIMAPAMPPPAMVMETMPPRVSNTTSGLDESSSFNWSSQGLYLKVEDTLDSVQRRLGLVINRAGMQRVRVDEQGVIRFDYYQKFEGEDGFFSKMAFWSRDKAEDYSGAYQVFARSDGEQTRVYIKYADGTDCEPDAAEHVLAVLRARLG
jgi:uncharacterized lipoprotein